MQTDGTLLVPDVPTVPYITGDGVGAEVTPAMQAVVDAAIRKAYGGNFYFNAVAYLFFKANDFTGYARFNFHDLCLL